MTKIQGYCGGKNHEPKTVLEACLWWDFQQGGTLQDFLPRLKLQPCGAYWHLMLDCTVLGHAPRYNGDGVTIHNFMEKYGRLDQVMAEPDYLYLADGRKVNATTEMRDGMLIITGISDFQIAVNA